MVGISEHHTGLAVDLVGETYQSLDESQANTPEAMWLNEHAHEYGFILRYPEKILLASFLNLGIIDMWVRKRRPL